MCSEDRRQQIVTVSAELFAQKGFNGTTTKEIADRAGVSEAIIFRHFPTKHVLYSAIIEHKARQNAERLKGRLKEAASRKDDRGFFLSLAQNMIDFHTNDPALMRLLMFSSLEGHEMSQMFFDSIASELKSLVLRYIRQRIQDGVFRHLDARVSTRAFIGMILFHAQVRVIHKHDAIDDVKLSNKQVAERFVDLFLGGMLCHPNP